jgi:hypothetical protein
MTPMGNAEQALSRCTRQSSTGVLIFTKRYYSEIIGMGGRPRPAAPSPANP